MSRRPGIGSNYVEQFKSDFFPSGYIIVDGPPVIGSADCSVIADSMDGVVLCAARGQTKLNAYRDAAKSLHPVPVLAKVLLEPPST